MPDDLARQAAALALGLVGLSDRLDYLPANLSGGQKQRVAVVRALVGNPSMILANEPTAAFDNDSAADVVDLFRRLGAKRGTTTLLVTHDTRILDRADRILTAGWADRLDHERNLLPRSKSARSYNNVERRGDAATP